MRSYKQPKVRSYNQPSCTKNNPAYFVLFPKRPPVFEVEVFVFPKRPPLELFVLPKPEVALEFPNKPPLPVLFEAVLPKRPPPELFVLLVFPNKLW